MEREIWQASDGKDINVAVWENVESPRGIVQISHGMAEHIARYDDFAKFLNSKGYIVFGDDHRGHGLTDPNALGLAGDGHLFDKTVDDMAGLTKEFSSRFNLPIVLLGHSYGSFLTQSYLLKHRHLISGCVLSGSADMGGGSVAMGSLIVKRRLKRKKDEPGKIMARLTFKSYDKKFKEGINGWLSRDKAEVGKYNTDEFCGFYCSNGFYYYFFEGLKAIQKADFATIDKDFKLMIVSGSRDYVGGNKAALVKKLNERYINAGLKPVFKLYEDARHEILNEINNAEVYADIEAFISKCI